MIRSITISGFRGVVHPLTIDLMKGGEPSSLMVFGRNGTGKSSITDAWEWFHSGTIGHLAKEGAKAGAYPSRLPGGAVASASYVEVNFQDPAGGTVRLPLPGGRGAAGAGAAGHDWFRAQTTHPCHVRFDDLGRFVYLTKTERFDELASLMGFVEQVEMQKQLRRVETKLAERVEVAERSLAAASADVVKHFKLAADDVVDDAAVLTWYAGLFGQHGMSDIVTWEYVDRAAAELTARVEHDKRAKELHALSTLTRAVERVSPPAAQEALSRYLAATEVFRGQERAAVAEMLFSLYEGGKSSVQRARADAAGSGAQQASPDVCPLCGQEYHGDLLAHIEGELNALAAVRGARDAADGLRSAARNAFPSSESLLRVLDQAVADAGESAEQFAFDNLRGWCREVDACATTLRRDLGTKVEALPEATVERLRTTSDALHTAVAGLLTEREMLLRGVGVRTALLADDGSRAKLVEDHGKVLRGRELWEACGRARRSRAALVHVHDQYHRLVERYIAMNLADVEQRFEAISADVDRYFSILEAQTDGVAHPALRLLRDQERAVVLEIEFRGDRVAPAYSYLSESQLNSFGLAVFLASVRYINRHFRVVILDDVVNSFDAYKRPQLIQLLKHEFADFQVVVLTHDDVWWTELMDQCPSWARVRFKRYEPGIGPVTETAPKSELERVRAYLDDDEPTQAARELGPMLERKLQVLCEAMHVTVTYNARNEYTLRPLLQCLVSRAKEKLGSAHPLYVAARALEENTTFRNFSAHAKNPASGITTAEVRQVLEMWLQIDALVRCKEPTCGVMTGWRSEVSHFACRCGSTVLSRTAPAPGVGAGGGRPPRRHRSQDEAP
jgi:hypothetical protein